MFVFIVLVLNLRKSISKSHFYVMFETLWYNNLQKTFPFMFVSKLMNAETHLQPYVAEFEEDSDNCGTHVLICIQAWLQTQPQTWHKKEKRENTFGHSKRLL